VQHSLAERPGPSDRVLMGEGYIVTTGADGHQYLVAVPGSAFRAKPIRCSIAE